jgi:hypothetical protein
MPGSFKGTKPGSHLHRTRTRPAGPSRVVRLFAFREVLYTRMEEISFRTSMSVLGGVVAFAAVVAAVSTLMSVSTGPAPHAALSGPPASAAPSSAPNPTRPAPASPSPSASPSSGPPSVTPSAVRDTGPSAGTHAPVTTVAAASAPSPIVPTPALSPSPARVSEQAAVAAWWSWWLRVYGRGGDRAYGGGTYGGFGRDRGGFGGDGGFGGGFGRR